MADSGFIGSCGDFEASKVVIFGAGADSTTSYRPGTRFGPSAIRAESYGIETYSPYLDRDLEDMAFFDAGDLELPFGSPARQLEMIEAKTAEILAAGKVPFMLGGEYLVTLGAVRAVAKAYPDLRIIHFDAHADLREEYLGETLSHATVMRRCHDILGDGRIWQFGIRSGTREEFAFMKAGHVKTEPFSCKTIGALTGGFSGLRDGETPSPHRSDVAMASSPLHAQHQNDVAMASSPLPPVYLTIDMDVLDPSEFPGTGTPEAGGLRYGELREAVMDILSRFRVVALDNVELSPPLDPTGRSTALSCKFVREQLLAIR